LARNLLVYQEVNALTVSKEPENNGDLAATSRENALDTLRALNLSRKVR
jgi:hypothetical protein